MEDTKKIPVYGSMTRPDGPDEGIKEVMEGRLEWKGQQINITFFTEEFTSVCPSTGQPDFNSITLSYTPNKYYAESKCIKFYLWSFRDYGIHCEYLADRLADDLMTALEAKRVKVIVEQKPRGGIALVSTAERYE
jgi:7-cyano-7-deazaguanine reductase